MSNDMLSQDEIDALLRGTDDPLEEESLSPMEQDALGEIGNISFGSSATALSTLLNQKVEITTPEVHVIPKGKLQEEFPHPYVAIEVSYTEGFLGSNLLVIKQSDASIIADLMLGGDGRNPADLMGEIQLSAVQEAMNQMMGSAATSMSTIFSKRVDISPPTIDLLDVAHGEGTERIPSEDLLVRVSFRLKIGDLIDSNIMQLVPFEFAKSLVNELLNPVPITREENKVEPPTPQPVSEPIPVVSEQSVPTMNQGNMQYHNELSQPGGNQYNSIHPNNDTQIPSFGNTGQSSPQHLGANGYASVGIQPNVQPAVFSNFENYSLPESESKNLNMLLDIPLQITVELGRTKRSVKEILELSAGSIVELDKLAGEPVDILVNSRLIAKGEVVVIEENFGVRVTDIISQSDRIKKLN